MTFLSRKPAWFMASYAMPPVMAPSPITAMQLFLRPCRHQAAAELYGRSCFEPSIFRTQASLSLLRAGAMQYRQSLELACPFSEHIQAGISSMLHALRPVPAIHTQSSAGPEYLQRPPLGAG